LQERDAARILDERVRDDELYISPVFSAVGDSARREDSAYLGHLANDGATCAPPTVAVLAMGTATWLYLLWVQLLGCSYWGYSYLAVLAMGTATWL